MELAEVVRSGLLGTLDIGGGTALQGLDRPQRMTENDEETHREECSSTESTHQEVMNTLQCGEKEYHTICVLSCPLIGN